MAKTVNCTECLKNKLYKIYKKTLAFTLAETLIVMGVIGVVAALTLPNLNQSTGNKEKVAKLQKIYSNLNDAFGRAEVVYGPMDTWFVNDGNDIDKKTKRTFERITEFMKYSKVCTVSDACSLFEGNNESGGVRARHAVILSDGSIVGWQIPDTIYVDVDGTKGANDFCIDTFQFTIGATDKQLRPENIYGDASISRGGRGASYCAAWVIKNGNMDYLKCSGLKFESNTTCK